MLAFGNPDYGVARTGVVARLRAGEVLIALPGTEEEARAVGDVVRVGAEATETRFREELDRGGAWRAVHFACHGVIDTERPGLSALALGADAENDGYLTAIDVLRLEIPAALAVLSGCETGKGKAVRGEGILGLPHAFIAAGVPAVLVSLWPVDDEATQTFMTTFYEAWNPDDGKEGAEAARALRTAQAAVRSDPRWRHPRHWAGWALWGHPL